jgi:DNA polymerase-3 subunit epsilon
MKIKGLYVDVETTGLTDDHAIIQLSGIVTINGDIKEEFDFRIKPLESDIIDDKALKVNGIKREAFSREEYLYPDVAYNKFTSLLGKYVGKFDRQDKFHFIAYNAKFDMDRLRAFFLKMSDKFFGSWFFFPYIDVMSLAATALVRQRHTMPNFKLLTVAETLGIDTTKFNLHDSLDDIKLTREVFMRLKVGLNQIYDTVKT